MTASLPPVVADYLAAVNAFNLDGMVAAFVPDAYVNDARREIGGIDAIRRWAEKEMVGDRVTMEPLQVVDHYGQAIVRSRYDGTYDKTNLPAVGCRRPSPPASRPCRPRSRTSRAALRDALADTPPE